MPISVAKTFKEYQYNYQHSISNPETFWFEEGKRLKWLEPYTKAKNTSFDINSFCNQWYANGVLNVSENCLDRHLKTQGDKVAILWEGDNPEESRALTYRELHEQVCKFANVMKDLGVFKGDRVVLYLPMIPEAAIAMLACTRIGAIHSVVFGGFSPESLANRIADCLPKLLITADTGCRGGKIIPFKKNVDEALRLKGTETIEKVIVVHRREEAVNWIEFRDLWYHDLMATVSAECPVTPVKSEDPMFILYTSGSTGKPKGILHATGGYLVYASMTFEHIFQHQPNDILWCTADIGWITGHSYIIYGPLANGATTLMFEGTPNYPTPERFWQIIDKYKVTLFYTAPTAIRSLIREGDQHLNSTHRESLRILGSVGEPIDPSSWQWYHDKVGQGRCPIVDTWWQTETGGILISPLPHVIPLKPGSATMPFYGVQPQIVDEKNGVLEGRCSGRLVLKDGWPGLAQTLYGDHDRFIQTYFSGVPDKYLTGDGVTRDEEGYYWITGRVDDVINVSGHRLGTAEIESALDAHETVIESAVVGFPHDLKGQGIYAYVVLDPQHIDRGCPVTLTKWVRDRIGPIATIDHIHFTQQLPKTRSGKVMRRILRKIASNELDNFGDTSTLLDPSVVNDLVENRVRRV